ncbi:MAG: hypothetical protein IPF72_15875 [Chitinophagaceae bacterium]|nr:hypothetical protein [Chitinophagaceae bacterium]
MRYRLFRLRLVSRHWRRLLLQLKFHQNNRWELPS